ncbi:MAG: LacI family DNA-binding transcriptional regulator [Geminicoccaceae bacterium]
MTTSKPRPRLKDLSEALGLSVTTVSRALGGHDDVSLATQERVRDKAREIGYVPSRAGRMLVSGATRSICLVVPAHDPTFIDPFLGAFVTGLGEGLSRHDLDLFIATVSRGQRELDVIRNIISTGRADAVVITRTERDDPRVRFLIDQGFPFVSHGRVKGERRAYAWYDSDGEQAFERATTSLIELGHHCFAYLGIEEPFSFVDYRRSGMEKALAKVDLALPSSHRIAARRGDRNDVLVACHSVLDLEPRPTAVLAVVDELALCLLDVAAERGVAIPDELSVIGFDNLPVSAYAKPPLSTFDHEPGVSAVHVATMLANQIDTPDGLKEAHLAPARFIPRGSHGPAVVTNP